MDELLSNSTRPEDYERAEKIIFKSLMAAERALEHAIHQEVDALFHGDDDDKDQDKVYRAVQKGAAKVREAGVSSFDHSSDPPDSRRILHAVEVAEQALLDAVRTEVENLFPTQKQHSLQKALDKVQERKEKYNKKRQEGLLHSSYQDMIENYENYVWE